jgi:teichoic acid transport system ATP-binding protein
MKNVAIKLTDVTKEYTIHHEKPTLVEKIIKSKNEYFTSLRNINLQINKGENVGIIGPNGSGKTTLLKIITGIATPTKGEVRTYGRLTPFIDLEAGFHPDLTGYQNVFLNGMILGMEKREIAEKLQSIIEFADIERFIDIPLFTYSQGMKLRLGFSIAVFSEPEILVLDEHLAIGDTLFQRKAEAKINEFRRKGKTMILVSHLLGFIKKVSSRIIIMNNGTIKSDGSIELIETYKRTMW